MSDYRQTRFIEKIEKECNRKKHRHTAHGETNKQTND